eukprot:CAMPEP_0185619424 /NCGR_PEP_ID=MMETSP0436-20130131/50567_1 /TAXON_ID=626734 ORGANISM="Favella taraikaensis, Strain Fe Narragansett Bay" /NCGR_SAMPLE_ID=MMETSP0436 /ASSEMBLY_ACC=CAM_ASM_000390 /LENGTH=106 /DNA_ID=CAMNT_0028258873 /DNA_START=405 /DNA_END=722 /DNA_ORIENTATION=+
MIYGVRDNAASMMFKDKIETFFGSEQDQAQRKLIVACSRDIDESQKSENASISYERGYVQDSLRKFDLPGWNGGDQNDPSGLYVMICGNKNALGASALSALQIGND